MSKNEKWMVDLDCSVKKIKWPIEVGSRSVHDTEAEAYRVALESLSTRVVVHERALNSLKQQRIDMMKLMLNNGW